jgi:hypothetical protein
MADPSSGEVSCEYTVAKDSSWLMINLHEGDFGLMRKSFGGKAPLSAPAVAKDAFLNESYEDFSAELFAKKSGAVTFQQVIVATGQTGTTPVAHDFIRDVTQYYASLPTGSPVTFDVLVNGLSIIEKSCLLKAGMTQAATLKCQ